MVEYPPALIHVLMLKKRSLGEYNINDSKNVVLGCTENHVPFVKQSSWWTSGTASKTIIIYFHRMSNKPCKAQVINVAC